MPLLCNVYGMIVPSPYNSAISLSFYTQTHCLVKYPLIILDGAYCANYQAASKDTDPQNSH